MSESPATYQVGGDHYTRLSVQPWEAMEAWMSTDEFRGYLRGNALKYLARAGSKGDARQDYAKAMHYLVRLLATFDDAKLAAAEHPQVPSAA